MAATTTAFQQLQGFLKDMFQFGDTDLDFGIYRITRLKREFIEAFIDGDGDTSLRATVTQALGHVRHQRGEAAQNWLDAFAGTLGQKGKPCWNALADKPDDKQLRAQFEALFVVAEDADRERAQIELATWLETRAADESELEARVYNHLLNFFELYYENGDFGYNTRAAKAFKVPYEADYDGTDTLFHWKHKDSYYIKTGNGFHSVRFEVDGKWLEFRLVDGDEDAAAKLAQNNNKDATRKHYRLAGIDKTTAPDTDGKPRELWQVRFTLATAGTPKTDIYPALWHTVFDADTRLTPYLYKKPGKNEGEPGKPVFNDLAGDYDNTDGGQIKGLGQLRLKFDKYIEDIAKRDEFADCGSNARKREEKLAASTLARSLWEIDRRLNQFYVGNDADYFIHKDLQGFLTREKARFIKNVVFSDLPALLHAGEDNLTVLIARAFDAVADRLIGFLAAIENFQKALFTMPKKVIGTGWLVSVGKIPASFHKRVFACKAQREEWQALYQVKVTKAAQLAEHPALVVDTRHYRDSDPDFQDGLLSDPAFDQLDEQTDGLLIHSENWQALNLLAASFRGAIKCIYIDPPYNTGGDGFLYKDRFRHSSWASMIHDRLEAAKPLLADNGVLFASIDDKERTQLEEQLRQTFGPGNRVEELIWEQNTTKNRSPTYSTNHEYVEVFAKDIEAAKADPVMFREPKPGYVDMMGLVQRLNPDYPGVDHLEDAIGNLFDKHRKQIKDELDEQGIEYSSKRDPWKGLYNYKHAEYRDASSNFVPEENAKEHNARIWIWREDNPSMPQVKEDSQKAEFRDPNDPAFRFYEPPHPITGEPCPAPKRGWAWPLKPMEGQTNCFEELAAKHRIAWGDGSKEKIPQVKRFLHEVDTNVARSVIADYTDGEKELERLFGRTRAFSNPKPTTLIERFVQQTTGAGEWVMDFFAGSGTTGHAVLKADEQRRFLLTEMGGYFESILVPRIKRVMYSRDWKNGAPSAPGTSRHLVKVQALEQYEDALDNLETAWDEAELPGNVPVRYLFHPDQNRLFASLDASRPFTQTLRVGKTRAETVIDLAETWCYLQGYRIRSKRFYRQFDRPYLAVETTHGVLTLWRDIDAGENDTDTLKAILEHYRDAEGLVRIERLEVNFDADLRYLQGIDTSLIHADDFLRGGAWS